MDGFSLDIRKEQIEKLKVLFPEVVSEDKIDWERLKATLGEDVTIQNERYVLNWAGKSDAFKTLQTGTSATLVPCKEESVNFDTTENIFIEGENLEVLKALQKSYFGKIKCIIIDPPYNTGSDSFVYPDKFSETKEEYMQRVGDKDEEGYLMKEGLFRKNSKENGQYHSNWLSMMYPRLFLAKNLLRDDGVIFVHIDDNEEHNLRLIMNEIFGEENYRNSIILRRGAKNVQMQFETIDKLGSGYETILMYTKNSDFRFQRLEKTLQEEKEGCWNNHWRGTDRPTMRYELFGILPEYGQWRWSKTRSIKAMENYYIMLNELNRTKNNITQNEIDNWYLKKIKESEQDIDLLRLSRNNKPEHYISPTNKTLANDVWFDLPANSTRIIKSYFGKMVFDNPKPIEVIRRILDFTNEDDIILDFFAGSGTTGHAILEFNIDNNANRKFILIQLPEKTDNKSVAFKEGFNTISQLSIERLRRVANIILRKDSVVRTNSITGGTEIGGIPFEQGSKELLKPRHPEVNKEKIGFKVFKLKPSNFKQWRPQIENIEELTTQIEEFIDPIKPESLEENILFELLLKSGYDLNSKIDVRQINGTKYYLINFSEMAIELSGTPSDIIDELISLKPKKVIILDRLFENNDKLKTNTFLQFKDAGMDFRTV